MAELCESLLLEKKERSLKARELGFALALWNQNLSEKEGGQPGKRSNRCRVTRGSGNQKEDGRRV